MNCEVIKMRCIVLNTRIRLIFAIQLFIIFYFLTPINSLQSAENEDKESQVSKSKITAETIFKAAFMQTRLHQLDAIKSVLGFHDYEKQYKITNKALEKIYEVIVSSKAIVENSDYIPGSALPVNVTVSEALGKIIDNTAMFGEFRLKLPDITERILKNHQDWNVLMQWAIGFSNSTSIFDDKTIKMINLLCQEMNLIPRDENFINPYRKYEAKVAEDSASFTKPKQKKPKTKKGPRMSKSKNIEL